MIWELVDEKEKKTGTTRKTPDVERMSGE